MICITINSALSLKPNANIDIYNARRDSDGALGKGDSATGGCRVFLYSETFRSCTLKALIDVVRECRARAY